jgi:hypothetical protein
MLDRVFSAKSFAIIFNDCRLLASGFREILFQHCNKKVGYELARHFADHVVHFLDNDTPSFILPKQQFSCA